MSDQLVAEISILQHTTFTTNIHASGGIRTHNINRRAATDIHLRPRGPWHRRNITMYRIIILSVVLDGCETWSLTLSEERRLRVFENRVLRRIFGPKRDGVTGEWRRLHNEEFYDLYWSPNVIRVVKSKRIMLAGFVVSSEDRRGVYRVFGGET